MVSKDELKIKLIKDILSDYSVPVEFKENCEALVVENNIGQIFSNIYTILHRWNIDDNINQRYSFDFKVFCGMVIERLKRIDQNKEQFV